MEGILHKWTNYMTGEAWWRALSRDLPGERVVVSSGGSNMGVSSAAEANGLQPQAHICLLRHKAAHLIHQRPQCHRGEPGYLSCACAHSFSALKMHH